MPYYKTLNKEEVIASSRTTTPTNDYSGAEALIRGSVDSSFRYRSPSQGEVTEIALNVAEPYSWWVDFNNLKRQTTEKFSEFDTSGLTVDRGHTWDLQKVRYKGLWDFSYTQSGYRYGFQNAFPSVAGGGLNSLLATLPASTIETYAATQYGRMAPTASEFSLGTFLGELREGLPRLIPDILHRAKTLKAAGSDYLAVEFGWLPLINDLRGLAEALLSASFGLYRPFGANHRRREAKPVENFSRWDGGTPVMSATYGNFGTLSGVTMPGTSWIAAAGCTANVSITSKTVVKQWAEGEFVYIPKAGFNPEKYLDRLETLMSLDITPSVLWELAPWSWLVDWYGQIGQSIASMEASSSNRVLSTYFYGMEERSSVTKTSMIRILSQTGRVYTGPDRVIAEVSRLHKRRVRGNPFGYSGSSSTVLSGPQMLILGALGLTKTR